MTSPIKKGSRVNATTELRARQGINAGAPGGGGGKSLAQVQVVADLLDRAIRIPGTDMRIGLDPILGLIPGAGDMIGAGLSGYLIILAARAGAPKSMLARMVANVAFDSLLGSVPVLGDLFDFAWKSNTKNVDLLREHIDRPTEASASSRGFVALMLVAIALLAAGAVWATVVVGKLLVGLITG